MRSVPQEATNTLGVKQRWVLPKLNILYSTETEGRKSPLHLCPFLK